MVDQIAVVTKTVSATGNVDFTDAAITETFHAALVIAARIASDDSNQTMGCLGFGAIGTLNGTQASGTLQFAYSVSMEDGVNVSAQGGTAQNRTQCVRLGDGAGGIDILAAYDSTITNGVRINFSQVDVTCIVTVILFAGLAASCTGDFTTNDSGGAHEDVGSGAGAFFQPDLLILASSDNTLNTDVVNAAFNIGFALNKAGVPQISAYWNYANNTDPTDCDGYYRTDCCSSGFIGTTRTDMDRIKISSFDSTGFNSDAIDTGGLNSPQAHYLALKFTGAVRMAIAHMAVAGSTGVQSFTSFGFNPGLVFGMAHLNTTGVDTIIDGTSVASGGYFVTGAYGSKAYSTSMQEGLDIGGAVTSVARTRGGSHGYLCLTDQAAVAHQAEWVGPTPGGFQLNFSTASVAGTMTALGLSLGLEEKNTEQISEGLAFTRKEAIPNTEQISEALLFKASEPLSEMERISDAVAFRRSQPFSETEQISDSPAFRRGLSTSDIERISDGFVTKVGVGAVFRITQEVEDILDGVGGLILADGLSALGPAGATFEAQAVAGGVFEEVVPQSGLSVQAGSDAGSTFQKGGAVAGVVEGG